MANHPNRAKKFSVATLGWHNAGLGWERDQDDDLTLMTRSEIEAYAKSRQNPEASSFIVYEVDAEDDDRVAECGRGETSVHWY